MEVEPYLPVRAESPLPLKEGSTFVDGSLDYWYSSMAGAPIGLESLPVVHVLVRPNRCVPKSSSLSDCGDGPEIIEGSTTTMHCLLLVRWILLSFPLLPLRLLS